MIFIKRISANIFCVLGLMARLNVFADSAPNDLVDPFIGTDAHGHTYPGATIPFGFVQLSPDTPMKGWDGCAGYHYSDDTILGFSHTHLSGTGIGDLGDVIVMPVTGPLQAGEKYEPLSENRFASKFSHTNELAVPGYYRVLLDKPGVTAELTATARAGMHRYTFSRPGEGHLILDLVHGINNQVASASIKVEDGIITGSRTTRGWNKQRTIFFALECSKPWDGIGLESGGQPLAGETRQAEGRNLRVHLDFNEASKEPILLRVGLSPTSVEAARKNLSAEIPSWDFNAVRQEASADWREALGRIEVETPNRETARTFYTAFYHAMTAPTLYNDADGSYRGPDKKIHQANFQYYSTFSLWDTFRAEHPLLTLVQPGRVNDFAQTFLAFYQESADHALPMWPLEGFETWCMIGYHAVPVLYDAYAKGFHGFDSALALKAMVDTATSGRFYQPQYEKLGYIATERGKRKNAAARTLENSFDDWCISQMAENLGQKPEAELFAKRAKNFTNVFDEKTGFFCGRMADGIFPDSFDPKAVDFDNYVEANGWQYSFAAVHDVPTMISLYGGNAAFVKKLDQLFDGDSDIHDYLVDVTGLVGQYSHGNEPCHHIAYLYALAGAQYKTALRVRQIINQHYDSTPAGICGNDDCGQMSAWYVWSVLGLYPLNPASGIYVIGSPALTKATIQLDPKFYNGQTFTVLAHNVSSQNIYVQSARLNGKPLEHPWVTHEEISHGGTLEFEMGILPQMKWGQEQLTKK